ncbi:hypothetical protein AXI57_14600 [Bacillus atrophaeus]|nr:hypothetical protein AXI57_14600 [Bacillus atrophaeus]
MCANGRRSALPKIRIITGTNRAKGQRARTEEGLLIQVLRSGKNESTPDESITAKVPAHIMAADIITEPIFFITHLNNTGLLNSITINKKV